MGALPPDLTERLVQAHQAGATDQQFAVDIAVAGQQQAKNIELQVVAGRQAHVPGFAGETVRDTIDPIQECSTQAGARSHCGQPAPRLAPAREQLLAFAVAEVGQGVGVGLEIVESMKPGKAESRRQFAAGE